jgi:hypothetical protein
MTTGAEPATNWAAIVAPLVVSVAALLFTVVSFWWLQARRGRLVSYVPLAYAGYFNPSAFRLRLPLTIYNNGARTLVLTNLRLVFLDDDMAIPVISFRKTLKPLTDDVADFAHPFAVSGRATESRFIEFGSDLWSPALDKTCRVRVDGRTGSDDVWSELVVMEFVLPPPSKADRYLAHRRDPADDTPLPP